MMRVVTILIMGILVGGCQVPFERWRESCRNTYTLQASADYQKVHNVLFEALQTYGWGEDFHTHQELHPDMGRGAMWPYASDPRDIWGFVIDVEAAGPDAAKIIVYPGDGYWERKSREWINKTMGRLSIKVSEL